LYGVTSVQVASVSIGLIEILLGTLLAVHRWWPRLAALGGLFVAMQFIVTVSFLFTTPNLSPEMTGFLSKDVMLFGAAVWATGESLERGRRDDK
jgi:reactive chlorine resistance protein C